MPRLPTKRWKRVLIYVTTCLVFAGVVDQSLVFWNRRITIGPDTTKITSPVINGYPDYLGDLNARMAQGVTPENNAAPLILQVTGIAGSASSPTPEPVRLAMCQILGIPNPGEPKLTSFAAWAKRRTFRVFADSALTAPAVVFAGDASDPPTEYDEKALNAEMDAAIAKPWTVQAHPLVADWLKDCEPSLAILAQAKDRSRCYIPLVTEDGQTSVVAGAGIVGSRMAGLGEMRHISAAFAARAMLRLQSGDEPGFQQDVLLLLKLAQFVDENPTLIGHLIAIAIDSRAWNCVQGAAASPFLSAGQADALRAVLEKTDPIPSCARAFDLGERYMSLDGLCTLQREGLDQHAATPLMRVIPVSCNTLLRDINRYHDELVEACRLPTYAQQSAALNAISVEMEARVDPPFPGRLVHPECGFLGLLLPSLGRAQTLNTTALAERDIALTALALRAAKSKFGTFPSHLEDLAAGGFVAPVDRFTGKQLVYRRIDQGFVVYSLGENLLDDNATSRAETTDMSHRKYDIVVKSDQ